MYKTIGIMKVIEGHLTENDKKSIKAIMDKGLMSGKVGKSTYHITKGVERFHVSKCKIDRGMIPVEGSKLRLSIYKSIFTVN